MSLEQYKNANRKELWEILQIQAEHITELEEKYEKLRLKVVEALNTGDLTNNAQKMITTLEE